MKFTKALVIVFTLFVSVGRCGLAAPPAPALTPLEASAGDDELRIRLEIGARPAKKRDQKPREPAKHTAQAG